MAKKQIEQTEIEAPYELPEGWKWMLMPEVVTWGSGGTPKATEPKYYTNGTIPWLIIADLNDSIVLKSSSKITKEGLENSTAKLVPPNTLLVAMYGSIGKLGITGIECCTNQAIAFAKELKNVTTKYMFYYMSAIKPLLIAMGRGGTQQNISQTLLNTLRVPLPPTLEEQQRIVNRIETLFAKLDLAKEKAQNVVDTFEPRKASILHKAFTGELTKKWRKENGVGDDSWEETTIGEAMHLQAGKNISANEISQIKDDLNCYPCFGGNGIRGFVKIFNQDGDFPIIGRQGALCGNLNYASGKFYATEHAVVVTCPNTINPEWACHTLRTMDLNQYATATAQPGLAVSNIVKLSISIPSILEQTEIVRILDTILKKESKSKEAAEAVLEQIDLLKKSILARAFRGEL